MICLTSIFVSAGLLFILNTWKLMKKETALPPLLTGILGICKACYLPTFKQRKLTYDKPYW